MSTAISHTTPTASNSAGKKPPATRKDQVQSLINRTQAAVTTLSDATKAIEATTNDPSLLDADPTIRDTVGKMTQVITNTQEVLQRTLPLLNGVAPTGSHPATVISPATLTLTQNGTIKHFKTTLLWGGHTYIVEQDLPLSTTEKDWNAIVGAYEQILNSTERSDQYHPGIPKLKLSLDSTQNSMDIEVLPEKTTSSKPAKPLHKHTVQSLIVRDLVSYHVENDGSRLDSYRQEDTLPATEKPQSPPIGIKNPSAHCCATNALLQMLFSYPYLRGQIQEILQGNTTILKALETYASEREKNPDKADRESGASPSEIDTESLQNLIFQIQGKTDTENKDLLETLEKLLALNPSPHALSVDHSTLQISQPLSSSSAPHHYTTKGGDRKLPVITLNPDPAQPVTISEAITRQKLGYTASQDPNATINISDPANPSAAPTVHKLVGEFEYFATPPSTLMIHANRNNQGQLNTGKITLSQKIFIPGQLINDLNGGAHYQLRSFATYEGKDATHGHFISYVKVKERDHKTHYYKLDDSTSLEIDEKTFLKASENFTLAMYDNVTKKPLYQNLLP